ncbi:ABC transporter ATP-binding protein [Rheinheimera sp.]|uniref:ABC transporter ATP-binding protein n=1 Tax=Rheinheimera sp. TaxID=1869214 RepID=UPI00307D1EA0
MIPVIQVDSVTKEYRSYSSMWKRVLAWFRVGNPASVSTRVLDQVSFSVMPGEAVALVGQNGAGKSTLLKIITGTIQPSAGQVHVQGKVSAILELGLGFNPEMTGRQNVYLAGAVMGYKTAELDGFIPFILDFSELGHYFDQPVRTYSSGMQMRLAFSIATASRPEVLIVDEALAVGDVAFQRKCFRRIEYFQENGTSLLFVSHSTESVKKLCERAIYLRGGQVVMDGASYRVCNEYEKALLTNVKDTDSDIISAASSPATFDFSLIPVNALKYGNGYADIQSCWIEDESGNKINVVESNQMFAWCYTVKFFRDTENPIYAMKMKTVEGISIYGTDTKYAHINTSERKSGDVITVKFFLKNNLAPAVYYFNCGVKGDINNEAEFYSRLVDCAMLKVVSHRGATLGDGLIDLDAQVSFLSFVD